MTLNGWTHHVSADFSPIQSEAVSGSLKHTITTLFVLIHCHFTATLSSDMERNVISSLQSSQSFFFSDPNLRQFFPSCFCVLSSSGSTTYYLHPETQLRQKVRQRGTRRLWIRGANSLSWMSEDMYIVSCYLWTHAVFIKRNSLLCCSLSVESLC